MALSPYLWSQAPVPPGNTILTALEMQLWHEVQQVSFSRYPNFTSSSFCVRVVYVYVNTWARVPAHAYVKATG